jgi:peroxiredoxin-like protein
MEQAKTSQPNVKYKTFSYHTDLNWVGDRAGMLHSTGKKEFRVASPPEFKGEEGVWSPEDLFVAAVNVCTMTTFLAFAERSKIPVVSYDTHAEGTLEFVDGGFQFTKIVLRPLIVVETREAVQQAEKTLRDAHHKCLISNSIKSTVSVEPEIKSADTLSGA